MTKLQKLIQEELNALSDIEQMQEMYPHVFENPEEEKKKVQEFIQNEDTPLVKYSISSTEKNMARSGLASQLLAIDDYELAKEAIRVFKKRLDLSP